MSRCTPVPGAFVVLRRPRHNGRMASAPSSVIVAGARTPIGTLLGGLSTMPASDLGALAIAAALDRGGVPAEAVDHVIMGQVLTAGAGQIPARRAAAAAGIAMDVPSLTVNKVCLSGLDAVVQADRMIRLGEAEVVIAGGQESMSLAPHLLPDLRAGRRFGGSRIQDHMEVDGLWDSFTDQGMGSLAESGNFGIAEVSRAAQDEYAVTSHQRAARAWRDGTMGREVVAVRVPQPRGGHAVVAEDEGIRPDTDLQALARLRPVFAPRGTITAGTASQISDGAAALVVMSKERAEREGRRWLTEIVGHASVAGPDSTLQVQPANAIATVCGRAGIEPAELDLVEINEAFAAIVLSAVKLLGLDLERVNVDGGAIALGHPIGASGARVVLHLAHRLAGRNRAIGVAALCGGGGQGDSLLLRSAAAQPPPHGSGAARGGRGTTGVDE